jgi:hypothetical protein
MADRVAFRPELEDLVPQHRGQLEIERLGRCLHLLLQEPDGAAALARRRAAPCRDARRPARQRTA